MRIKSLVDEDFTNYKEPAMFIGCISCGGKCAKEGNFDISICQNDEWRKAAIVEVEDDWLIRRYLNNPITRCIVFGLLEPFEQFDEMFKFINTLRNVYLNEDPVIIYTGYTEEEIKAKVNILSEIGRNIIIKYGRFKLNNDKHYDHVLGVMLASDNQYAKRIS